jgi:hypothetical protein
MHGMNGEGSARKAARQRKLKVAPVTRAVRSALAASAAMLALAGSGPAFAGDCTAPVDNTVHCSGTFFDPIAYDVDDLTLVLDAGSVAFDPVTVSGQGDVSAFNEGMILATLAVYGSSSATVTNEYRIHATESVPGGVAYGILATSAGDITIDNEGGVQTSGSNGTVGISAVSSGSGTISITNGADAGGIFAQDPFSGADVIGMYAYSPGGEVDINNEGPITAKSAGLADGIFAYAESVHLDNSGVVRAYGASWAAGIEVQAADDVYINNSGGAGGLTGYAAGGHAYGIYATAGAGGITIVSDGNTAATGYYSTGISAAAEGDVDVATSGNAIVGNASIYGTSTALATGVHASSTGEGSSVSVSNDGSISVLGTYGAIGIEALSYGAGGTAGASNTGTIYANAYSKYGYGATGIAASGDGDAWVDNSGSITASSGGSAYGAMALSFNGEASIINSGDVTATANGFLYYGGYGLLAVSQNGSADVTNAGDITVAASLGKGIGIQAEGFSGAAVTNSGTIAVDGKYAYGVFATAGQGDVDVLNDAAGVIDAYSGFQYATGMFGFSGLGDVSLSNDGEVYANGYSRSIGMFARGAQGDAAAANSGVIHAYAYSGAAVGIYANADYGTASVSNTGYIGATSPAPYYGVAFGVLAAGDTVDVSNEGDIKANGYVFARGVDARGTTSTSVTNTDSITAVALGDARGISANGGDGVASISNSGYVAAGSQYLDAIGIYAYSHGDVDVSNNGYIRAVAPYGLADGIFASGANVTVDSGADATIVAVGYSWAAGIEAQGSESVAVSNAGDIIVQTLDVSEGFGIYAAGAQASVDNSGTVYVRGYDQATGVYARGDAMASVTNSGGVYAGYFDNGYASSYATSLMAVSSGDGSDAAIDNSGFLSAISFASSSGAEARALGTGGSAGVTNAGDVVAIALSTGGSAAGLVAAADGDATIDNAGTVYAHSGGMAYGALAVAFNGEASVNNSGDIASINTAYPYYSAYGIVSSSQNGSAMAANSGSIYAYSPYIGVGMEVAGLGGAAATNSGDIESNAWVSYGIRASSGQGDVFVDNGGSIYAHYTGYYSPFLAFGVHAETVAGDITVDNGGDIASLAARQSFGIFASSATGDIVVDNSGSVASASYSDLAAPIFATNAGGDVDVRNSGDLIGYSVYGPVAGAFARASQGTASITNSGAIASNTMGTAYGALVRGYYAEAHNSGNIDASGGNAYGMYVDGTMYAAVENSGDISASTGDGYAFGVMAIGLYGAAVSNSGHISASAGENGLAVGVMAQSYYDVLVENSGTISATQPDVAIAVQLYSAAGTATLDNSGMLVTDTSSAGSIAVLGSHGANVIDNTGDIYGAIVTFDADDQFTNGEGGIWHIANGTTYFGGGDDAIENGADGTIHFSDGAVYLGSSGPGGNSFHNAGTILTSDFGLIDMGGAGSNPLVNDGVIDFVDGSPDDMLVVLGDLGGDGAINLDLSVLHGGADLLYVDGNVVNGTTQTINLQIDGTPTALKGTPAPVVAVTGNVPAGSFVGGQVLNFDASNFLDLGVTLHTASAGGANVVTAAVDVNGLNGTGVLGASLAQGMHSLVNSAVGTRSERMGLLAPPADGSVGISPWLRVYSNNGNLSPEGSGLGAGQDFGFRQENRGREIGVDFAFGGNLSIGLLAGNADGDQRIDGGAGGTHFKQQGVGLYGTWIGRNLYVDVSHRTMDIDARLQGTTGDRQTSAQASASNIEAGFTGWSAGGFAITPQVQYTRSKIDHVDRLGGSQVRMAIEGGKSERGRIGVALSRSFDAGSGFTWTPYGALSAVREFDGKSGFTIADTFSGSTSVEGSGTLAELGVGVRKGGLSATAGLNWADGGAVDNVRGGQVVVRYSW